uniref:Xylulose kinase-1 n=1 Tax=Tanacetum cinerariifolium TaxID=118510 RepID=A0A6L2LP54_TANCI|nr:xylulose kinase-1 [Tanacetum cinerariifolium]
MMLTFADTQNMIAYLIKSDASEGFNQIIDFLNESSIKYALTVNPNIYVSCIKQFWNTVAVKKVNDVTRLQALVDKEKVVIIEATIRDALRLDDAEGRKFNFSKYIFDSLIRNVDRPTKFYMYPCFLQLMIRKQVGDLSSHSTKYTSPALTQKVFANMRRIGKGFFRVDTPVFKGMLVAQEVGEGAKEVHVEDVNTAGVVAEGAASDDVNAVVDEPSIPSPTPPTPPPPPSQDMPSTSQLKRRNKVKVLKLRRLKRVGTTQRIDTSYDTVMDDVSKQGGIIANIDADEDVDLKDAKDVVVEKSAEIKEKSETTKFQEVVDVVTTAKIITKVVTAASDTITAASTTVTVADAQVSAATIIAAPSKLTATPRRRKGVVIRDPEETITPSTIIYSEAKSKDKGKGILVEDLKPLKKQAQIKHDEDFARELETELNKNIDWEEVIDHVHKKAKEDNAVKRYQALKRKPQTKAQARKNMMIYLKNVAGFKMDYLKGMYYDDIRPIFEKKFNSNVAFLQKTKEQIDEEESRALKRPNESQKDKAAKRQKLDEEVSVVDYKIYNEHNKPYYKIKRANGSHQLHLSFLSMLKNFDIEDLEALWRLVKERFATIKPKNFSDDFLLTTLGAMFEKPDIQAQIWKNQRSVHGQAKVKSWKLLESCGVQIITFTTTQLILLVERKYQLTKFTLNQMLNNVRLEVEEKSEVSLELLRFTRQQQQEGFIQE